METEQSGFNLSENEERKHTHTIGVNNIMMEEKT